MKTLAALLVIAALTSPARAELADSAQPALDPFKALIVEAAPPQAIIDNPPVVLPQPPPPAPLPPVNFKVNALAVDGAQRVAVVEFEGQSYIVQPGTAVPDASTPAFTVKEVTDTEVKVWDPRVSRMVNRQIVE